jgi:hypothetical protein
MRTLRQCLLDTDPTLLHVIAERWGIDPTGLKVRELAAQVENTIGDPARAGSMLDVLSSIECEALRTLLAAGGTLPAPNFSQRFGSIRLVGPARLEREQPWRSPVSPAEGLWYLGLLYKGFEQLPNGVMREVFIAPAELAPLLPLLKAPALPTEPLPLAPTPDQIDSQRDWLADDLCTLLAHLHNNFVRVLGAASKAGLDHRPIDPFLHMASPERIDFMLRLARRARLLKLDAQRLRPDSRPAADWLQSSSLDQLRILYEAWRADPDRSDVQDVAAIQIERDASWNGDPIPARTVVLDALRGAVPNAWHTFEAFVQRIKSETPDLARSNFETGYIRDTSNGEYLRGFAAWDQVEGELIRYLLTGPLHWLGAIDLGDDANFSLTAIGAALLGIETADQPLASDGPRHFIVRADASIQVAYARRYDRFQLSRFADLAESLKGGYRYRLTPSTLSRAQSQKIPPARVIEFLSEAAGQALLPSLVKAIERWSSKGTEVKVERVAIVRVKDPAILKRLQESPKTRSFILEELGPTAARINERDWPKLAALLAELGVLVDE